MNGGDLQIGEVATLSGVSVDTVRCYVRLKLLSRAIRLIGGFRIFPAEVIERIKFIRQAQEMNFSPDEIKQLFSSDGANQCQIMRELLSKKLSEMEMKIKQMRNFKKILNRSLEKI